jgi:hypothetical protein
VRQESKDFNEGASASFWHDKDVTVPDSSDVGERRPHADCSARTAMRQEPIPDRGTLYRFELGARSGRTRRICYGSITGSCDACY